MIVMIMLSIFILSWTSYAKRDEVLGGWASGLSTPPGPQRLQDGWVGGGLGGLPALLLQFKGHLGRDQAILGGHQDLTHQSQSSILAKKKQEVEVQSFDSKGDFLIGPLCSALKWKNQAELLFHEILYLKGNLWLAAWSFFISILNRESPAKNYLYE